MYSPLDSYGLPHVTMSEMIGLLCTAIRAQGQLAVFCYDAGITNQQMRVAVNAWMEHELERLQGSDPGKLLRMVEAPRPRNLKMGSWGAVHLCLSACT